MNFHLLMPEWAALGAMGLLLLFELVGFQDGVLYKKVRNLLLLSGTVAVFAALFSARAQIGTAFGGTVIVDPFATFFKFLFLLAFAVTLQMTREFFRARQEHASEFFLILWICLAGFFLLVSSNDFLLLFLALETVTLGFYILNAYLKNNSLGIEAGMKYFILGSLASAVMIFGISLIYVVAGSTAFPAVRDAFIHAPANPLMVSGSFLVLVGLFFKIGAFPFQLWIPDVYEGAPAPAVGFLSVASKSAGFAALLRILFTVFLPLEEKRVLLFTDLALVTLLYGSLGALVQKQIKRLLGYSSIGHAGYLLIALAAGKETGVTALLYYLMAYAVTTLSVFLVISIAGRELGSDQIDAYRGLGKRSPFLAGAMFLALLSSAGVPPLAGFMGKFLVLFTAVQAHLNLLALVGTMAVAVSLFYYLSIVRVMYFDESSHDHEPIALCPASKTILLALSAAILILGFYQAPFLHYAQHAAHYLF